MQGDYEPLHRGQLLDLGAHERDRYRGLQALVGQLLPALRRRAPEARALVTGRDEPIRVDRRLVRVGLRGRQRRERDAAVLALAAGLGPIGEDPEDPGLQRRAPFEAVEPLED